jgi:serine/threonine-protein kinase
VRIEDYLGDTPEPEQSALLRELLMLDLELRREKGESPTQQEYHLRFPEHVDLINDVFAEVKPRNTQEPSHQDRPEAHRVVGDYELLDELGKGGMGVVYRAHQRSADRIVALKLIRPDKLEGGDRAIPQRSPGSSAAES